MIDEKKIEEAKEEIFDNEFELYSYDIEYPDGNIYIYRMFTSDQLKRAISFGAHWVISEFLKDLWHDASEEPSKEKPNLLVRDTSGYPSSTNTKCMFNNTRWVSYSAMWKEYTEFLDVEKWLYIDDLLEQKGGE